jgi:hypothetical protein
MENISIESVEASFHQWRSQRSSRAELIPEYLWNMALALYPQYNRSKICHRLGLKGGQFKQRLDNFCPALTDTGFILASNDEARVTPESGIAVKLLVYDGTGFWLCTKRFSQGKLNYWPKSCDERVCATTMAIILNQGQPAAMSPAWRALPSSA